MKKYITIVITTLSFLSILTQVALTQNKTKDKFNEMSLSIEINKTNYVLQEPIYVKFYYSNQTNFPLSTYSPVFLQESTLKVSSGDKVSEYQNLSSTNGVPFRLPRTYKPQEISVSNEMLNSAFVGMIFPKSGNYLLQIILKSSDGSKSILSNAVEVTVENPIGVDKEAFDYLKKHEDFFGLSSWTCGRPNAEVLLETFVNNYSQSVYGELAVSSLGYLYLCENKFDKAKSEFEKLVSSENNFIAESAKKSLEEIKKKKDDLAKQRKNPQ